MTLKGIVKPASHTVIRHIKLLCSSFVSFSESKLLGSDKKLPKLPEAFMRLPRSQHGLFKLIRDYEFNSVLDVGSGAGEHAEMFASQGKTVTALDFGTNVHSRISESKNHDIRKIDANFYEVTFDEKFDCIWASHVLEHQPDSGQFIRRCMDLAKEDGVLAITVPPLKHTIVGGHLSLWNPGLLLYQLVFNGLDCRDAAICTYDYNITILVRNRRRKDVALKWDSGDIEALKKYFPEFVNEPFNGQIAQWNW